MIYRNQNKIIKSLSHFFCITHFFYKQHFYKQRQVEIKQIISNIPRLNYLKNIHILHPRYQLNIIGHILKDKLKNKCVCIHMINYNKNEDANEITWIT